mgnify:CR=1 FL=1
MTTQSQDGATTVPSTDKQRNLASLLAQELNDMGAQDVVYDKAHCYVYATIPSNLPEGKTAPVIGFISHMDTSPAVSGENVNPRVVAYEGGDIILNAEKNIVLTEKENPELAHFVGKHLIVTDGNTLLGADDKAGVAEIMTMAQELLSNKNLVHGKIRIGFTPDEEVGRGADFFDVEDFGADFAYTVDGGAENEIEYENFNAAGAKVKIKGFSVHPGSSKNTMINAALVAMEFNNMLPAGDTPANTEEYEGFFHLCEMSGDVSSASLDYIIRDHDSAMFACRQELMRHIVKLLNEKYGEGTVTLIIKEQYRNMKEKIEPCMHLIDNAKKAVQQSGLNPKTVAIRGGTDGARLSFMGLPCPNLGTGGYAFHGPCEHITVEGMDYAVENLKNIVKLYAC